MPKPHCIPEAALFAYYDGRVALVNVPHGADVWSLPDYPPPPEFVHEEPGEVVERVFTRIGPMRPRLPGLRVFVECGPIGKDTDAQSKGKGDA